MNSNNCCCCSTFPHSHLGPFHLEGYYEFMKSSDQLFLALTGVTCQKSGCWSKLEHPGVLHFPEIWLWYSHFHSPGTQQKQCLKLPLTTGFGKSLPLTTHMFHLTCFPDQCNEYKSWTINITAIQGTGCSRTCSRQWSLLLPVTAIARHVSPFPSNAAGSSALLLRPLFL